MDGVTSPFDQYAEGVIAEDDSAAIISVRLRRQTPPTSPPPPSRPWRTRRAALQAALPGSEASVGGQAFSGETPGLSISEGMGVLVALVVLFFTLGSLRAAGMPLLTALLGVGLTMALIFGATGVATISSTTPLLALMLGLAVGIDYALFITSRHRDQLRDGMDAEESVARAVATSGSAVVFAGMTVMIALCGLAVAGIPFLTTMGVAAAIGVAIAVLIALTLLPALLGFAGESLRPKPRRVRGGAAAAAGRRGRASRAGARPARARGETGLGRRWVRLVTKVPVLTVVLVVAGLGVVSYPALDLRLALPSNGTAAPGTPARTTYDLIAEHYGAGYNGPLVVSATIVGSDDPLGLMDDLADDLRALPGVASVPLATPNEDASAGIVQVIPEGAPDSTETKDLVRAIRDAAPALEAKYDVPIAVTGFTAVGIDVSDRLGGALLPFGVLVVGLSLVLLAMVFRSVAVPLKATIGFLLSVGRRLRRHGRRLRVGLVRLAAQRRADRPGDQLPADPADGHPLRPGHGLRGVPRLPDPRGVRAPGPPLGPRHLGRRARPPSRRASSPPPGSSSRPPSSCSPSSRPSCPRARGRSRRSPSAWPSASSSTRSWSG